MEKLLCTIWANGNYKCIANINAYFSILNEINLRLPQKNTRLCVLHFF